MGLPKACVASPPLDRQVLASQVHRQAVGCLLPYHLRLQVFKTAPLRILAVLAHPQVFPLLEQPGFHPAGLLAL